MSKRVTFDVVAIAKALGFDKASRDVKKLGDSGKSGLGPLMTTLVALGPAMIPLSAGATALAGTFVGLGAAGLLAFKGIAAEMKAGSYLGVAYTNAFKPIVDEYHALSYLSAVQMFTGINRAVQTSRGLFPLLATDISKLAYQFGQIVSHLAPALVALFVRLNPLFDFLGNELVRLSGGFERWATSGTGVTKFVQYAVANLPMVEHTLAALVVAIYHLLQGLAPLGGVSFSTIGLLSRLVAAIPINVLREVAPIITGIVLATKAWAVGEKVLNTVLEMNPFIRVASLILAVGTALVIAYQHSQTFRNVVKTVFKDVELAFLYAGKFAIQYLLIPVLDVYSAIVHGAAAAFGWVPGIGGKLKKARAAFDTFRRGVDIALHGINVQIDTLQAGRALAFVHEKIAELHDKKITISTYVQQVILPTLGTYSVTHDSHRAAGGPAYRGMPLVVGEHRPELFIPPSNGRIVPRVSGAGGAAAEGWDGTVRLEFVGADSAFLEFMRKTVRVRGGNVQTVIGNGT